MEGNARMTDKQLTDQTLSGGAPPAGRPGRRGARFLLVFGLVALAVAGGLSYLADSSPDGLDTVTLRGCEVIDTEAGETLSGTCMAVEAREHPLAVGPLADYALDGDSRFTGVAGVIGVLVTLALAGGLFRLLRRRSPTSES